jgi:hypothetical protein
LTLLGSWIAGLAGDDCPYPTPWICYISAPSWHQVYMTMGNRLTCNGADIYTDIESFDRAIHTDNLIAKSPQKVVDSDRFREVQFKERCNVSTWQNKRVERCNRMDITNRKCELRTRHDN